MGLAAGSIILLIYDDAFGPDDFALIAADGAVAALVATATAVIWAISDFRVVPAAVRGPNGDTALGASLRLRY